MEKAKVKKTMEMLDGLEFMVNNWHEMQVALFMWQRYGSLEETTEEDLKEIGHILDNYDSVFDLYLIEEVEKIVHPNQNAV